MVEPGNGWITPKAGCLLPPTELYHRLTLVQVAAQRLFAQIPADAVERQLSGRSRSYAGLAFHIFHITELFIAHMTLSRPLVEGDYDRTPPPFWGTKGSILAYGRDVQTRLHTWWMESGKGTNFAAPANIYYGTQSSLEYFASTTAHAAHHVRQLAVVVQHLGLEPDRPLNCDFYSGLPMPTDIWGSSSR